ncbi:unnamed protein product [Candidula unifasciata]|uniref:Uncharacterized protein n=1 Tax=Candidula unifasciata TaxID=100452 RepID=A0A8S3Z7S7_9EUPU|nr:unnamed protein product [Candidula unifasciata]
MAWTINTLVKLVLLALIPLCYSRPSLLDGEDDPGYIQDQESPRRFYVPVEVPLDAIFSSLRAHTQSLHQSSPLLDKRAASGSEGIGSILPKMDEDADLRGMKRKMFWQPLGYLPASVRAHNSPTGSSASENQASSSVFRYG